jgi:hypothetical protein
LHSWPAPKIADENQFGRRPEALNEIAIRQLEDFLPGTRTL